MDHVDRVEICQSRRGAAESTVGCHTDLNHTVDGESRPLFRVSRLIPVVQLPNLDVMPTPGECGGEVHDHGQDT